MSDSLHHKKSKHESDKSKKKSMKGDVKKRKDKGSDSKEKREDKTSDSKEKRRLPQSEATTAKRTKDAESMFPGFKVSCMGMSECESFAAVTDFKSVHFHDKLAPLTAAFSKPTPIQAYSWPILSAGKDMVGIAETGSGKTLAFALPILSKILERNLKDGKVRTLVVAPTRELAMQTFEVISKVIDQAVCLYGGVSRGEQQRMIQSKRPFVVVGTPGRLVDFIREGILRLADLEYFILDEADRMLDLGFEPDIREIVAAIPEKRQTVMFSATWPSSIQTMAARYLVDPIKVYIKAADQGTSRDRASDGEEQDEDGPSNQQKASTRVHQVVQVVKDPFARDPILLELLGRFHSSRTNRVLVFVLYKKEADRIERLLRSNRWTCVSIHGDKPQWERTEALASFKSGKVPLMIATDVAARGLDIPDVEFVINFTFPLTIEDYIHRIGRTGRGGAYGTAHTLFTDADKAHSGALINVLKASSNAAEIPQELYNYGTTIKKKVHKEYGAFYKDVDPMAKASHVKFDNDDDE